MTTEQFFHKYLLDRGMFGVQADAVMIKFKDDCHKILPTYQITWDQPAHEYPEVLLTSWSVKLDRIALEWIDLNCPSAWFRDVFKSSD